MYDLDKAASTAILERAKDEELEALEESRILGEGQNSVDPAAEILEGRSEERDVGRTVLAAFFSTRAVSENETRRRRCTASELRA